MRGDLTLTGAVRRIEGPLLYVRRSASVGLNEAVQIIDSENRQRVGRIAALDEDQMIIEVLEPKFVMLDEPTSALDMSVQAQIVELLRKLQKTHDLAYLFISHDLKVVRALANDVVVMRNGVVVEQGPADEIFENPKTDYTKALLAAAFDLKVAAGSAVSQ